RRTWILAPGYADRSLHEHATCPRSIGAGECQTWDFRLQDLWQESGPGDYPQTPDLRIQATLGNLRSPSVEVRTATGTGKRSPGRVE
ncbi:MAG: hypothetical protein AB1758_33415, partial [Candidatus Eremiobacterota bacterium]